MMEPNRFIVLYETPAEHGWKTNHTVTKALLVWDNPDEPTLPYGFWVDYLGPDEDVVTAIVALIPVHPDDKNPTVVIDDKSYRFDETGAPHLVDEENYVG